MSSKSEKFKSLGHGQKFFLIDRLVLRKSFRVVRLKLTQYIPDSGQEHLADSDDSLLMSLVRFAPVIPLFKFRVLFGFDKSIDNSDKKRFQITADAGEPPGFYFLIALAITRTAASPGNLSKPERV